MNQTNHDALAPEGQSAGKVSKDSNSKIRILVADDHDIVRRGLRALFQAKPRLEVCGEAVSGREVVEKSKQLAPDVVVLDLNMPELRAPEAVREVMKACPGAEVLILTMDESPQAMRESLKAGARGYVFKSDLDTDLVAAVEAVSEHQPFFTSRVSAAMYRDYIESGGIGKAHGPASGVAALTPRQRQVVQLIAQGKTNKGVAEALKISVKTADAHRTNIMHRLELHSLGELVRFAIREGIIEP